MSRFFLVFFSSLLLFSCKKLPVSVSDQTAAQEFSDFAIDEMDFTYFSSKAKIQYKDQQNDLKANANIRMKKDSVIWISINAAAGIEAMRILITVDSIQVLDRINGNYTVYDFNTLSQKLNINLDFKMTQAMLVGNLMLKRAKTDKISKPDSIYYILNQTDSVIKVKNYVGIGNRKIEKVEIEHQNQSNQLSIKYLNFIALGVFQFPSQNEINLSYKDDLSNSYQTNIQVDHNKAECLEKELNFPFNVPNKFLRK